MPTGVRHTFTIRKLIMQREIVFRGKRLDNGQWIKGYYCWSMGRHYITEVHCVMPSLSDPGGEYYEDTQEIDPETLGQLQKYLLNGEELYEGDIASCSVVGLDGYCKPIERHVGEVMVYSISPFTINMCQNIKKLGNKFDDTSLLPKADMPF